MAKYNVGDKVKVREDLASEHGASAKMVKRWAGKVVTISEVDPVNVLFGVMHGAYNIEEDDSEPGMKYLWNDKCFEDGKAEGDGTGEVKSDNTMPELTTGMFGLEEDGDMFVVVGDHVIYRGGSYEDVPDKSWYDHIVALYEGKCFDQIADGNGDLIWERNPKSEDVKEVKDEEADPVRDEIREVLEALAKALGDKK